MIEADIAILGDFRFPGGTSTAISAEIAALSEAGYRIAVMAIEAPFLSKRRSFHPSISQQIEAGNALLVREGESVRARLACLHHPAVFENFPAENLNLKAENVLLIVHHPPLNAAGQPQYEVRTIDRVLQQIFSTRVQWAPVGPKVRSAFGRLQSAPPLTSEDWFNVIDVDRYSGARPGLLSGRPVLGRHSRPGKLKWPDTRETMLEAYPASPDVRVRLMGFENASVEELTEIPPNWDLIPFQGEPVPKFLNSIDFLPYFHHPDWIEAFGRSILEAMASGVVCILPQHFEPLFGTGAVYCNPKDVLSVVRALHRSPERFQQQSSAGVALVKERFSPRVAVDRIRKRIGPPKKRLQPPTLKAGKKPRILYLTSNGIGMGHITRCLAIARRHRDAADPIIVSMSRAYSIARREGMMAEYIPFFRSSGMDEEKWHWTLKLELLEIFRFYRPSAVVLDGNVPYEGLLGALDLMPEVRSVWLRRAMWPQGAGEHFIKRHDAFDAAVEPGEFAADFDHGATVQKRSDTLLVPPVTYLFEDEALPRSAARAVLGLDPDRPAVFLQLGAGNNMDKRRILNQVAEKLQSDISGERPQIVAGQWLIGMNNNELPEGVIPFSGFPFSRFLNAFDYAVAVAGYNTFHENLLAGLPTLFLGNEHPEHDEQRLRADFAKICGYSLAARSFDKYAISESLFRLSDPGVQASLRSRCTKLPKDNGAHDIARFLSDFVHTRKSSSAFASR